MAGVEPTRVTDMDARGQPKWSVAPFAIAAPFYSADQDGRAGYNPAFVERIRHAPTSCADGATEMQFRFFGT